jgi:miniconductance mechanosensitive channel
MEWLSELNIYLQGLFADFGFSAKYAVYTIESIYFVFSILLYLLVDTVVVKYVKKYIKKFADKSKSNIDNYLFDNKVFAYFLHIITIYVWLIFVELVLVEFDLLRTLVVIALKLYMDYYMVRGIIAIFNSINDIYNSRQQDRKKSIKSYIQVFQLLAIVIGVLVAISIVVAKDISFLLTGVGAFAAVLMLIFKDTILGFVGGIQINANNMLELGDWISVPDAGSDGVVIDISLTTVKVQNWDKTISTIPTYSLVSNTFHNWRGMEESGGRRIKRHLNINIHSIKFLKDTEIEKLKNIRLLTDYLNKKEDELKKYNEQLGIKGEFTNGRHQTNIGVFRAYVELYLKEKKEINTDMTFLVRQLQATEKGLPLEIYVFSKIQEWGVYEAIQADIFDHLFAVLPEFGLTAFQNPSGADFQSLVK